jgi:hypothetical protein
MKGKRSIAKVPGSVRVSRVGFGVSPKQSFFRQCITTEVRDGGDAIATRETRALPGISRYRARR